MRHVVLFSGGVGSWAAAKRVRVEPNDELILLFTDTRNEHPDLYRFIVEAAENVGGELVTIADGRNLWELFNDKKFIGNTRVDICSSTLKRNITRDWFHDNCDPADTTAYIGIDWSEAHRFDRARPLWDPFTLKAPLIDPPLWSKSELFAMVEDEGIELPWLYRQGFTHNNCGGFCVKAGHGSFKKLLAADPATYAYHEEQERLFRERIGKDVAVLRDRRGGTTKPFTMEAFRLEVEAATDTAQLALWDADVSCAECML